MKKRISVVVTVLIAAVVIALSIFTALAAQSGIRFGSGDTLFETLDGVKSGSVGSLNDVSSGSGNYTATKLDSGRSFHVFEDSASTVPGGKLTFTYSDATVGSNEYISVIITDSANKALYYGKLKSVTSSAASSGEVELSLPELSGTSYNLLFFSEQCSSSGDKASPFSQVTLLIFKDPYILTTSLPETTKGVNYSYQLRVDTTASSCTWSISSGSLPTGLKLDPSTGVISGSPTVQGTFNFTVKVTTSSGGTSQSGLSIKINPPISITLSTDLAGASGTEISIPKGRTVLLSAAVSGGTPGYSNYSWDLDGTPIKGADSVTYKVPTSEIGTFKYTFAVSDAATANAKSSITVTVREPIEPKLTYGSLVFDKAAPGNIQLTKSDGDYDFTGNIICGSKTLTIGDDFTITGNTITLPIDTLKNFALGDHTLTLDYDDTTADPSFTLSIIDSSLPPEVGRITAPAAIDRGNRLSLTAPTVTTWGADVTSQGWEIKPANATDFVKFDPGTALECSYNGASLRYYATNKAGTTTSNTVFITVNHTPKAKWQSSVTEHWHECAGTACGEKFDVAAHERNSNGDCTICGHHCTHDFSNYISNNNATCTTDGTKTRTCSKCGYTETITDAGTATGHQWSNWQVSATQHWRICLNCSAKSELGDHTPGIPATTQTPQVCTTCGMVLAEKLADDTTTSSGSETTAPSGGETTAPSGSDTTAPSGNETTAPSGSDTTVPSGNETTAPSGSETTVPSGTETTGPSGNGTTDPSGGGTTSPSPGSDTSTPGGESDTNKVINITRKDDDSDDKPSFKTDTDISDSTLITVDDRPFTRDEYTISDDGYELELDPSDKLEPGKHTLVIETPYGRGETTFTIGSDSSGSSFPFWTLWVIPHVFIDIAGLICIALLAIKRDDDKNDDSVDAHNADSSK